MKTLTIKKKDIEYSLSIPVDNNFSNENIYIEPNYKFLCLFNGNILKIYDYLNENFLNELNIENINEDIFNINKILLQKTIIIDKKVYFVFYCKEENNNILFFISINVLDKSLEFVYKKIDQLNEDDFKFFIMHDNICLYRKINKNKEIKIISFNNDEEYFINMNEEISNERFNNLIFIDEIKETYNFSKNKYELFEFPFYIYNNFDNSSSIINVDFIKKKYYEVKIKNLYFDENKKIKNIFIKNNTSNNIFKIYYIENDIKKNIYFNLIKTKKEFFDLDTEFIVDSGIEGNLYVEIKSNKPAYDKNNKNIFIAKNINNNNIECISEEDNKNINVENNIESELINNRDILLGSLFNVSNLDLTYLDNIKNISNNKSKNKLFIQEYSKDIKGSVFLLSQSENDDQNKVLIRNTNNNNNIPIMVEGKTTNANFNNNYRIIYENKLPFIPNKNIKCLFPNINKVNNSFSSFTTNKNNFYIIQNIFLNYIKNYNYNYDKNEDLLFTDIIKDEKSDIYKKLFYIYFKKYLGKNDSINISDHLQKFKIFCDVFDNCEKNDIINSSTETDQNVFEYKNEYGGYKLKD